MQAMQPIVSSPDKTGFFSPMCWLAVKIDRMRYDYIYLETVIKFLLLNLKKSER